MRSLLLPLLLSRAAAGASPSMAAQAESRWSAAWFGEPGLNPGLKLAVEQRWTPLWRPRLQGHLFGGPALGATVHPHSHLRTLLAAEVGAGLTLSGVDLEVRLSGGGGYAFLASPTYTLSEGGDALERVPLAGNWAWMPSASVGLGSALRHPHRRWFARGGLMVHTPYHDAWAPFALLEIGVSSRIGT